jgi:hypothetical protein
MWVFMKKNAEPAVTASSDTPAEFARLRDAPKDFSTDLAVEFMKESAR